MADAASATTQPAAMDSVPDTTATSTLPSAASRDGTPSVSFQAVNSRPPLENARNATGTPAAAAAAGQPRGDPSDLTPHGGVAAVAPTTAQTVQTSTSAPQPSKSSSHHDPLDSAMAIQPEASYGTRSRNRTSTRPNYAEDQEMDFEYSSSAATTGKKKASETSSSTTNTLTQASDTKRAPEVTSFQAINGHGGSVAGAGGKDSSASTPTATTTGTSKKRKAAGHAAAALQATTASATPPPVAARKPAAPAGLSSQARETNVMSFSKHRACLNKKGELIADDGTKLSVNGKLRFDSPDLAHEPHKPRKWRLQPYPTPHTYTQTHRHTDTQAQTHTHPPTPTSTPIHPYTQLNLPRPSADFQS